MEVDDVKEREKETRLYRERKALYTDEGTVKVKKFLTPQNFVVITVKILKFQTPENLL